MKKGTIAKLGLTVLMLFLVFRKVPPSEILEIMFSINIYYFIISLAFVPVMYALRTYRWKIFLESLAIHRSFLNLYKNLIIGLFYGLLTPGKVGEVCRANYMREDRSAVISTICVEKITDISILVILCAISIYIFFKSDIYFLYTLLICFLILIAMSIALINKKLINFISNLLKIDQTSRDSYLNGLKTLSTDKNALMQSTVIGFFYYIIAYISSFFLILSMDVDPIAVASYPIITLMGNIPLTISGVGLRESVGGVCFVLLGLEGAYGVTFSLLMFLIYVLVPGLLGYILIINNDLYK
jgi:glycosyltransferase 2 family protein